MATQSNRLDKASAREFVRRFGSGLKNSDFSPNTPVRASQREAASGRPNIPEETNSSESRIPPRAENAGLRHCSDAENAFDAPSNKSGDNSLTEIDFAELKDGTLVELVEDSRNPGQTCFAVWKDSEVQFADRLDQDGQALVPFSRNDEVLASLRLPSAALPYESVQVLLRGLETLISQCVAVDEKYLPVLADFALSTWFVDRFSVAPYLSLVGLPQSGKTTLLKVLSLVCRRSLLIADITSASFYRACTRFMPTMLIDETATVANDRALRHILRSGTTRDVAALRRNHTFHAYGAKVISWLEPPNDPALNSRCILIPMFESKSTALARADEPKVQQMAAQLQAQLLRFRFENYKSVESAPVPGDASLRPRTRDLLRALTAAHADVQRSQGLLRFLESGQGIQQEPLDPEHNALLRALFSMVHLREDFHSIWISDLTQQVNICLELEGEKLRLQPRKVGAVLTSLGFSSRTRTNSGWVLSLTRRDAEKLHQLAASYGVDRAGRSFRRISPDRCPLCRAAGLDKRGPALAPEATTRMKVDLRKELNAQVRVNP
jgi:hypothetical protein